MVEYPGTARERFLARETMYPKMATPLAPRETRRIAKRNVAVAYAVANGWGIALTRGGHLRITKGRRMVHTGSTPSDPRGPQNARSLLRQYDRQTGEQTHHDSYSHTEEAP